ncbi:uncharacterized protein LAJ45_04538 [Morchella importuna]|uniref:uncharacterized protein n=1 Tax=Morchella importuna TaxID=1174673 RepID=UPI001E8CC88D|nr:uncharacterized protein LAJ45_04538 [Morchella importuna]KAH8151336.1 hypothetical protein LAJ45_04538 [Morchella importuna]
MALLNFIFPSSFFSSSSPAPVVKRRRHLSEKTPLQPKRRTPLRGAQKQPTDLLNSGPQTTLNAVPIPSPSSATTNPSPILPTANALTSSDPAPVPLYTKRG